MRQITVSLMIIGLTILILGQSNADGIPLVNAAHVGPEPDQAKIAAPFIKNGTSSLFFLQNQGQVDGAIQFYTPTGQGRQIWLTPEGIWLSQPTGNAKERVSLKLTFPGANPKVELTPFNPLETKFTAIKSATPDVTSTSSKLWQGVRYRNVYPGLDLEILTEDGQLRWQFVMQGQQTASSIFKMWGLDRLLRPQTPEVQVQLSGVDDLQLVGNQLEAKVSHNIFQLPLFGLVDETGQPVAATFAPRVNHHTVSQPFGGNLPQPQTSPIAQPVQPPPSPQPRSAYLTYSAFLGGSAEECIFNCVMTVDAGGSVYVSGYTRSPDFPTTAGVYNPTYSGNTDLFVVKINADGTSLDYATLIGGDGAEFNSGMAVDPAGRVYLTGYTASQNFPTTPTAFQPNYGGGFADAFVIKLNATGSRLIYSSFLGGSDNERGAAIAVDRRGSAYVTGETQSPDFPTTTTAIQAKLAGNSDSFVVKISPPGTNLTYGTFLGGDGRDDGRALVIDAAGDIYLTGRTNSTDFPVTPNAIASSLNGFADAFIAKFNETETSLNYATYLGGNSNDQSNAITVDGQGHAYVVGSTLSPDFPVTANGFDREADGGYDVFVAKVTPQGDRLAYATYLGGSGGDRGFGIVLDNAGQAIITGHTYSTDFPTTNRAVDVIHDGQFADAFIARLNATGDGLTYATFLGGDQSDYGTAIGVDGLGSIYVVGATQSPQFPVSGNTFGPKLQGSWDGFVSKLTIGPGAARDDQTIASIGGVVRQRNGFGLGEVVISAGAQGSTITDENGSFALIGLEPGIYTLTPIKEGMIFSPKERTVSVPSAEGLAVFTAIPDQPAPAPFLDLPMDYGDSPANFVHILQDAHDGGWVTSWFDHAYPDYAKNRNLLPWDGQTRTRAGFNASLGCYERRCYDDHNGIDLTYRPLPGYVRGLNSREIRAAADGTVVARRTDCVIGQRWCGGGYGNIVIIYHEQGYFTFYGHLDSVAPIGRTVQAGDKIGVMGSTGNSTGPHLHFGLHRDDGNQKWDGEKVDLPVDPFGWQGSEGDPWVLDRAGPVSHYLWRYPLAQATPFAGLAGTVITDVTGQIEVRVPPNTFSGEGTLNLGLGAIADSTAGLRRVGQPFSLSLQEWLPDGANRQADTIAALDSGLSQPLTVTATYTDAQVNHLDLTRLVFARWNETARSWQTLPARHDPVAQTITAETDKLGHFDLQAPLLCPDDPVEPDDAFFNARGIEVNGDPLPRTFDSNRDEDWFYLEAAPNRTYHIQTQQLASGVDTILELYSVDSATQLAADDNSGGGSASHLVWETAWGGFYFIRAIPTTSSVTNCEASYALAVTVEPSQMFLPLVLK